MSETAGARDDNCTSEGIAHARHAVATHLELQVPLHARSLFPVAARALVDYASRLDHSVS